MQPPSQSRLYVHRCWPRQSAPNDATATEPVLSGARWQCSDSHQWYRFYHDIRTKYRLLSLPTTFQSLWRQTAPNSPLESPRPKHILSLRPVAGHRSGQACRHEQWPCYSTGGDFELWVSIGFKRHSCNRKKQLNAACGGIISIYAALRAR